MTGMDRWIDWSKDDFIGSGAARKERDNDSATRSLVTLEVEATDADATGYEPVWNGDRRVGYITSGDYGHTTGKSLAMALIDREHTAEGTELTTHIVGVERPVLGNRPLTLRPERHGDANRRPIRLGRWARAMTPKGAG